jgi:hypothetical protein
LVNPHVRIVSQYGPMAVASQTHAPSAQTPAK